MGELANQDAGKKRACHRPQAETAEGDLAEQIAKPKHQIDRKVGVRFQKTGKFPLAHAASPCFS